MSLAPAAYLLYQRILRHDPADPQWPGRDRFVLSCGHSSLTLYIQLAGLSGYASGSRRPGSPVPHLGVDHPRPPGVRPDPGRGGHHRAARPGHRQRGRHGDGRPPRARPVRPRRRARPVAVRPLRLRVLLRRRHRRGHQPRVLLDRRRAGARQPDRDVRRQLHLDRGQHPHRQVGGRRRPLRGLRLARPARGLAHRRRRLPRERAGALRRVRGGQGGHRQAVVHRAAHDHRLARADQEGHRRRARLRPRRPRGRRDQGDPRVRPGGQLPGRGGGAVAGARGRRARQGPARGVGRAVQELGKAVFRTVLALRPDAPSQLSARGLGGRTLPEFPADPERHRHPRRTSGDDSRPPSRRVLPELRGGSSRPSPSPNHTTMEGEPSFLPGEPPDPDAAGRPAGRPDAALRHPRARHGLDTQRHRRTRWDPRLRRNVPAVQRLHARRRATGGADGAPGHLRLDARLGRPRRGRPDAPADRAPVVAAEHSAPRRGPPGRRQLQAVGGLAGDPGADGPARRPSCPVPARTCPRSTG